MIDVTTRRVVLWLGIEDYAGLWEVEWDLRSQLPELPDGDLRDRAEQAVRDAIARGWLELFRVRDPAGPPEPLPDAELERVLADPAAWQPPDAHGVAIRIGTTPAGEMAYEETWAGQEGSSRP